MNERFARLRLARLWLWPLAGAVAVIAVHLMTGAQGTPPFVSVAYVTYGLLFLAALSASRNAGISVRELFGDVSRDLTLWRNLVLLVPVMFCFAAMTLWATAYAASWVAPDFAAYLFREQRDPGPLKDLGKSGSFFLIIFVVIFGPIVEEIVFRGLVLGRWAAKKGLWRGVIGSSFVFAFLHPPFWIGAMVVGVFLSMLYVSTRSLYVPIVFHGLYNGLVTIATIGAERLPDTGKTTSLMQFRQQWIGETVLLLLSGAIVAVAIRRHWTRVREQRREQLRVQSENAYSTESATVS